MPIDQTRHIKHAQKEAVLLKKLASFFLEIVRDDSSLLDLSINRVRLSPDRRLCTIFFYTSKGQQAFKEILPQLILYKPSLRHALAHDTTFRHTPDLRFVFDKQFEKQQRIEHLIDQAAKEDTEKS